MAANKLISPNKVKAYMTNLNEINTLILDALTELNQMLLPEKRFKPSTDLKLAGAEGVLDSLAMVNLLVIMEEMVYDRLNLEITLAGISMSEKATPFIDVSHLAEYILGLTREKSD